MTSPVTPYTFEEVEVPTADRSLGKPRTQADIAKFGMIGFAIIGLLSFAAATVLGAGLFSLEILFPNQDCAAAGFLLFAGCGFSLAVGSVTSLSSLTIFSLRWIMTPKKRRSNGTA